MVTVRRRLPGRCQCLWTGYPRCSRGSSGSSFSVFHAESGPRTWNTYRPLRLGILRPHLLRPVCSRFVVGRWGRSSLCHKCIPSGGGQPIARYKREASCESVCERGTDFLSFLRRDSSVLFFSFFLFFQSRFLAPFSRDLIVVCRCELKLVT